MYSTAIAYLLWIFSGFGVLGFHRFYLGKIGTGLLYLFTGGLFGIGALYDLVTMPLQVREANLRLDYRNALINSMGGPAGGRGPLDRTGTGSSRFVGSGGGVGSGKKESLEQIILKTARNNRGVVTPSTIAVESGKTLDEVKKNLDTLVEKGYADLKVTRSGTLVYFFGEFAGSDPHPDLEDI